MDLLTQNIMLNPNKMYFTQQLTSVPLKWRRFLLILPGMVVAVCEARQLLGWGL